MEDVDLRHAKEHLEELIERARRGEDVRISDAKGGIVRLIPGDQQPRQQSRVVFGICKNLADISEARMIAPLTGDDLEWLSGEKSE